MGAGGASTMFSLPLGTHRGAGISLKGVYFSSFSLVKYECGRDFQRGRYFIDFLGDHWTSAQFLQRL